MSRTIKSLLAACALVALAPTAYAEPATPEIRVAYGDLNLDDAADARVLMVRLERAARRVCGGNPYFDRHYDIASRATDARFAACYRSALDNAVAQFDAPHLGRAYARSRGARPALFASR